jgi:hypothetical protein
MKRRKQQVKFLNVLDCTRTLSFHEKKLLSRGLGFVPRKTAGSRPEIFFPTFANRIRKILEPPRGANQDQFNTKPIKIKLPPNEVHEFPKFRKTDKQLESFLRKLNTELWDRVKVSLTGNLSHNLSVGEKKALFSLRRNFEIIIKPSDKGSRVVVVKRADYLREGNRYFTDRPEAYRPIPESLQHQNFLALQDIMNRMVDRGFLTETEMGFLASGTQMAYREMYYLLKDHKPKEKWSGGVPPLRPIVANVGTEFAESSKMVTKALEPCLADVNFLIKNTQDFLEKLNKVVDGITPENRQNLLLVTADIESCYTNIPQRAAIDSVREALTQAQPRLRDYSNLFVEDIMALLELQMTNNDIHFNNKFYLQTQGVSMGQSWGPTVCNIFFNEMDEYIVRTYKPLFYGRFIDDTFFLWPHSRERLDEMILDINGRWPGVKLNFEVSAQMLPFLDIEVLIEKTDPRTVLYRPHFKPTDSHELLHRSSNHPNHTFGGILKSTVLRLRRNSSRRSDLLAALEKIRSALLPRGYTEKFLDRHLNPELQPNPKREEDVVLPLVTDFDPRIAKDLAWARNQWNHFLDHQPHYKAKLGSMTVAWRCTKNLKKLLTNKNSNDTKMF